MKMSRFFILLILLASLISIGFGFYKYYIVQDFTVFANVSCEPNQESCFVGDGENTPLYYKTVSKNASTIPVCDAWEGECAELTCEEDVTCSVEYCQPDEETECSSPIISE